jgi:hypothetical protein
MPQPNITGPRFGGAGIPFQEVPSGTVNGTNQTFTLSHTPWNAANLVLWRDGQPVPQVGGANGYSITGVTITMGTAPANGQSLYAHYYY